MTDAEDGKMLSANERRAVIEALNRVLADDYDGDIPIEYFKTALFRLRRASSPAPEGSAKLPPGRTKQDVANLVDLALTDSLVPIGDGHGDRFDYDILVEKLRGNGLSIVAVADQQIDIAKAALSSDKEP